MSLRRRTTVAFGAIFAIAGTIAAVMPGSAGAQPAGVSDQVTVSGLIVVNPKTGAFHVVANRCRLTSTDDGATPINCALTASGTGGSGTARVISAEGVLSTTFNLCGCGQLSGSGTERDFGEGSHAATIHGALTSRTPTANPHVSRFSAAFTVYDGTVTG